MDKLAVEPRGTAPTPWTHFLSAIAAFVGERLIGRPKHGAVTITFPNGKSRTFGNPATGEHAVLHLKNFSVLMNTMRRGTVGFAQSYIDGDVEIADLTGLFRYFLQNREVLDNSEKSWYGRAAQDISYHMSRHNSKEGSKQNISEHYDLGNDFYTEWLDPSMTYSSALYERPDMTLEEAQQAKYAAIANQLNLKPGSRLLEIGSGWGGFAEYAARTHGANVTSVTISDAQHDYAVERIKKAGLADQVDIQMRDYRDITGQFDAVASIEMFEAVGEKYWPQYFGKIAEVLKPGGKAALQIITIDGKLFADYKSRPDFIQHYIFPGGMLPSVERLKSETERAGMTFKTARMFGLDYARTLHEWEVRFEHAWSDIRSEAFDDRFRRLWLYYLAYCQAGFRTGRVNVGHFELTK